MNILIVDDEPVIRIGLRTLIDWESHGMRLEAEAGDGAEALRCIEEREIDILVTDIRMPRMDGLELIRRARAIRDDLGVLVLSCLDDFLFVREAMKLGASDYMLKPTMEPEELVAALQTIRNQIGEKRLAKSRMDDWHAQFEQTKQAQANGWLARAIGGNAGESRFDREIWDKPVHYYSICVAVSSGTELPPEELGLAGCIAYTRFRDCASVYMLEIPAIPSKQEQYRLRSQSVQLAADCLQKKAGASRQDWFVGVGPVFANAGELALALDTHARQLKHRFYEAGTSVLWDDAAEAGAREDALPYELRNDVLKAIANGNGDALFHHIERIGEWFAAHRPSLERLHAYVFELLGLSVGYARENGYGRLEPFESDYVSLERIRAFFRLGDLSLWLTEAMRALWSCRFASFARSDTNNPFVRKAVQFMRENYSRNIGTLDIAGHVKLSRSYLSDLYGKETGESLIETLTRIRIEEAKKRLVSGERKVYEIAEEVGFADPKSFAKTFKRLVGCSPKEYDLQNK